MDAARLLILFTCSAWLVAGVASAQVRSEDRVTIAFSDPSRPGSVRVGALHASIHVAGYDGKEVVVNARHREAAGSEEVRSQPSHRLTPIFAGLTIKEAENVMSISGAPRRPVDLTIHVPTNTALKVIGVTEGDITIGNLAGEIEIETTNGNVILTKIAGPVAAYSENGNVRASFVRVDAEKPISLSSLNGDIALELPGDVRATLRMQTEKGKVGSDFDMQFRASVQPKLEQVREPAGRGVRLKYHVKVERSLNATLNGGGTEIYLRSFKGDINIHRAKG